MDDPIATARALVRERFPEALAAFLGGSTARGEGTATSDLDIVVVRPAPAEVYREAVHRAGWPVELFVNTPDSVRTMFAWDRANGVPSMAYMCARGVVLLSVDGTAERLQERAEESIDDGPAEVDAAELESRRYFLTDLRDDLIGTTDPDELLIVAALLLERAAGLLLAAGGHWQGRGKWLPRWLRAADPELAEQLLSGYRTLVCGGPREPFAAAVAVALDRCGGPLRAGYHRTADARMLAGPATDRE